MTLATFTLAARLAATAGILLACTLPVTVAAQDPSPPAKAEASGETTSDIDALMARVLKNRDQSWRQLQEFLLSEREQLSLTGPDFTRLYGIDREFIWVARDGKAVRTVTRVNGVQVSGGTMRVAKSDDEEATLGKFMRFPFDPGNYYLAGRETIGAVEVLRIEYYPTRMFRSDDKEPRQRDAVEERLDVAFNKVSQVTLWVDPAQHQIVRATFDNVDFSFLPGRSLVRVESAQATMEMGQPFAGIWLPARTSIEGAATLATGTYRVSYEREYYDYRRTDVRVRFRFREPEPEPETKPKSDRKPEPDR